MVEGALTISINHTEHDTHRLLTTTAHEPAETLPLRTANVPIYIVKGLQYDLFIMLQSYLYCKDLFIWLQYVVGRIRARSG